MNDEIQAQLDKIIDLTVTSIVAERDLGKTLRAMTEAERTEAAFYMTDMFITHPHLPEKCGVTLAGIERYFAHHLKVADWFVSMDALHDVYEELSEFIDGPIEDLEE